MDANLIENLQSSDEKIQREAYNSLDDIPCSELKKILKDLFSIITKDGDTMMRMKVASNITRVFQEIPAALDESFDLLKDTFNYLADQDLSDESLLGTAAIYLFQPLVPKFSTNSIMLKEWLNILFKLINSPGSIKHSASGPIVTAAMNNPIILKDHVDNIFDGIGQGFQSLTSALYPLYSYNPEAYEKRIDFFLREYQNDPHYQSFYVMILSEIAKKKPELLIPHALLFQSGLTNPSLGSSILMLYTEIASKDASVLYPVVDQLVQAVKYNPNMVYQTPNILGLIGRLSEEYAKEIIPHLFSMYETGNDNAKAMVLSEIRNLGEMNKSLIEPYIDRIKTFESSPQEMIRDQAKMIVDHYNGIDIRSLANKIEEQNEKIKNACQSVDELMKYVDENIAELKEFISEIAKKIPTPRTFSTEGRIRKTIILHFVCDKEGERCIFPHDRDFTTETKDWNKWLKIAFSGINIGKSIITPTAIGGAAKAVKSAYDAYKTEYDKDFLAYISQPFLTSSEQDNLVNQLRDAKFFDVFHYNAQIAGWICTMCNL